MYRKKTKIIIVMLVAIVFMAVGYAILSTSLNINGSTAVTSNWQVEFSDIRTISQKEEQQTVLILQLQQQQQTLK